MLSDRSPQGIVLKHLQVNSPEETARFAHEFAATLVADDTVGFYGNLGSGKTFFIQKLCDYFHTAEEPTSPTFTIINEYHATGGLIIYHFDFYRLEHHGELANLGLEDYFYDDNLCLIEWADKIQPYLPLPRYEIYLELVAGKPQARKISIYRCKQ